MVLELGELAEMRKKEAEHLKRFVAATHNVWVEKWQTSVTNYPRRSIFFGTTNEAGFLSDPTGSRRWLPFEAGNCDPDWIAANRDQLFAEGAHLFRTHGVMFAQAEKLARDVSVDFSTVDSWDDVIGPWAAVHNQHGAKPILIVDALRNGIGLTTAQINRAAEMRAAASLQRLGYIRVQRRLEEGRRVWAYVKQT
jgi:predicted P-loop ATPase